MRYELMLPHQIRQAIAETWPVILPVGVLEYHGEHLAVGMDMLAVSRIFDRLEQELDLVILPAFPYGAASYAVAPPEGNGSIQVGGTPLSGFAEALFTSLLRVGFRNIHFFIHHQTENFAAGMPTDLAFRLAGRQAIFKFLEAEWGEGWWGSDTMSGYYAAQAEAADPFNWIQGHPLMGPEITAQYPFDHAAKGETSLMMALCPEGVDMDRLDESHWYTRSAGEASRELGARGTELILARLKRLLGRLD